MKPLYLAQKKNPTRRWAFLIQSEQIILLEVLCSWVQRREPLLELRHQVCVFRACLCVSHAFPCLPFCVHLQAESCLCLRPLHQLFSLCLPWLLNVLPCVFCDLCVQALPQVRRYPQRVLSWLVLLYRPEPSQQLIHKQKPKSRAIYSFESPSTAHMRLFPSTRRTILRLTAFI